MNIAFERSIRNALYPMIHRKNRNIDNHFESRSFKFFRLTEMPFNFSIFHIMLISILHDVIIRSYFDRINGGIIPRTIRDPIIYNSKPLLPQEDLDTLFDSFNPDKHYTQPQEFSFEFSYKALLHHYPFLLDVNITPKKMLTILKQIDQTMFNLKFNLRFIETKTYSFKDGSQHTNVTARNKVFSTLDKKPTKLFSLDVNQLIHDGRGLKDMFFKLNFTTFFGYATLHGIVMLNIDFVPEEIYTSKISEVAKWFFICFLVGRHKALLLKHRDIIDRLHLTDNRLDQQDKTIRVILEKLKEHNLLSDYQVLGKIRNRTYHVSK